MSSALNPAVVFRRRSGWEAADLGVFLWRNNLLPMFLFMGIPAALLVSIHIITIRLEPKWISQITVLLIWWIKPLLDRFGLQVVSVRFFEPRSSFQSVFKNLGKTIREGIAGDLLWRRFSLYRSARMPLLVLERIRGKTYKRRKQLLARNGLGFGLPLTCICISMSVTLNFGELVFLQNVYSNLANNPVNLIDFFNDKIYLLSILFYINELLIEMLYVSMGFSLYINSRVETEGWDIELLFKTCVEKTKRTFRKLTPAALVLLLFINVNPVWAEEKKPAVPEIFRPAPISKNAEEAINRILESPAFGTEKPGRKIQFKKSNDDPKPKKETKGLSFPSLKEILALILRFILGAALIAALGAGAFFAYRYRKRLFPNFAKGKSSVLKEQFLDEPQMLLQQAEESHRKGKIREAWALCFRAFTAGFSRRWFLPIPAEATEYETLALVRRTQRFGCKNSAETEQASITGSSKTSACIEGFAVFVRLWIVFAYGGQKPAAGTFEDALASCRTLLENPGANA